MTVTVRLEGGEELLRKLNELDLNVKRELRAAGVAGAEEIRALANGMAPGPHVEIDVVRTTGTVVEVAIGPDAEHWYYRFHERGAVAHEIHGAELLAFDGASGLVITPRVSHPGMAAQPFLRPAMDENEGPATDAMGARLRAAVESV